MKWQQMLHHFCVQHKGPRGAERRGQKGGGARTHSGMSLVYLGRHPPPHPRHEATNEQFQINQGQITCIILIRKAPILSPLAHLEAWLPAPARNTCSGNTLCLGDCAGSFREWWHCCLRSACLWRQEQAGRAPGGFLAALGFPGHRRRSAVFWSTASTIPSVARRYKLLT